MPTQPPRARSSRRFLADEATQTLGRLHRQGRHPSRDGGRVHGQQRAARRAAEEAGVRRLHPTRAGRGASGRAGLGGARGDAPGVRVGEADRTARLSRTNARGQPDRRRPARSTSSQPPSAIATAAGARDPYRDQHRRTPFQQPAEPDHGQPRAPRRGRASHRARTPARASGRVPGIADSRRALERTEDGDQPRRHGCRHRHPHRHLRPPRPASPAREAGRRRASIAP